MRTHAAAGGTVWFELLGPVWCIEVIAVGGTIHHIRRLRRLHGPGRWRKLKGVALVRLEDGRAWIAEVHWYEAHGIGRCEMKIKRLIGAPP